MNGGRSRADSAMDEIQGIIKRLSTYVGKRSTDSSTEQVISLSNDFRGLRHLLVDSNPPRKAKDAFRRSGGFEMTFDATKVLLDGLTENENLNDIRSERFEALKCALMVLSDSVFDHQGNRQYCSDLHGWNNLEGAIAKFIHTQSQLSSQEGIDCIYEQRLIFGLLFAVALREDSLEAMFRSHPARGDANVVSSKHADDSSGTTSDTESKSHKIGHVFGKTDFLSNPEVVPVIFNVWREVRKTIFSLEEQGSQNAHAESTLSPEALADRIGLLKDLSIQVVLALISLTKANTFNAVAIHNSKVAMAVLESTFLSDQGTYDHLVLSEFSLELLKLGTGSVENSVRCFQAAEDSPEICKTLLSGIKGSKGPPHLLFDLSMHGYASLEFSELKNPFPPREPRPGYSITAWIRVLEFDESCHATIFGAFDASQTCFVLLYLESGTHQLVLQTSISSKNPSVRFKSVKFQEHRWYHIAIVHQGRNTTVPGLVTLYVDGEFCEQKRCPYPESPVFRVDDPNQQQHQQARYVTSPVQCFYGTPQDLSPRLGKNVLSLKWALASAHLFSELLSDDLVLVYSQMGPSYRGNFQDCLGSFQTYKASTILNLRNEERNAHDDNDSVISTAVRSRAGKLNPENNVSLSVSPLSLLSVDHPEQYRNWSLKTRANIETRFNSLSTQLSLNAAVPNLARAVAKPSGVGSIMGGVVVYRPTSLENSCWRMSGCIPTALRLIALASTPDCLISALQVSLELVRTNWRNSEAMERGSGFGVLAWMLRAKLFPESTTALQLVKPVEYDNDDDSKSTRSLSETLLQLILRFVGFDGREPENSIISNPLAYRQLVVDCGVWEKSGRATQHLYFEQFRILASRSRHHIFNAKRLNRMRIVKKFIEAMKARSIADDAAVNMFGSLKDLLECNVTAEALRSLALYITYALFSNGTSQTRLGVKISMESEQGDYLTSMDLGIESLNMLASFLCETSETARIHKFARTVTSKWLLHLLSRDDSRVIVPAFRILVHVLLAGGVKYLAKFEEKHGFVILKRRLRQWWRVPEVWSSCWALLFGPEYTHIAFSDPTAASTLANVLFEGSSVEFYCPDMIQVLLTMTEASLTTDLLLYRQTNDDQQHEQEGDLKRESGLAIVSSGVETLIALYNSSVFRRFNTSRNLTRDLLALLFAAAENDRDKRPQAMQQSSVEDLTENSTGDFKDDGGDSLKTTDLASDLPKLSAAVVQNGNSATEVLPRIRRNSSFVMVNSKQLEADVIPNFAKPLGSAAEFSDGVAFDHLLFRQVVRLLVAILKDQVISQPEFSGLGLFLKAPTTTVEKRSAINSLVLRETMKATTQDIASNPRPLHDPKILANLVRFTQQTFEAITEGWLVNGSSYLLDLVATILEYLKRSEIRVLKSIRLCSPTVTLLQGLFWRLCLYEYFTQGNLSNSDASTSPSRTQPTTEGVTVARETSEGEIQFLTNLLAWSELLFGSKDVDDPSVSPPNSDPILLRALCYMLFQSILKGSDQVRTVAIKVLAKVVSQSSRQLRAILRSGDAEELWSEFARTVVSTPDAVTTWLPIYGDRLGNVVEGTMKSSLVQFVQRENVSCLSTGNARVAKRDERLHQFHLHELAEQHAWTEHDLATGPWADNICESEVFKHFRFRQDQQDGQEYFEALYRRYDALSQRLASVGLDPATKWSLDETEGRYRMRLRLTPSEDAKDLEYKPKRRQTIAHESKSRALSIPDQRKRASSAQTPALAAKALDGTLSAGVQTPPLGTTEQREHTTPGEDFEIVQGFEDDLEDKNRKVMRSLQRGEQVHSVYNVSRIRGLEACESLLIVGEKSLYLLSHLFQRSDGEIVNEWQAPTSERDPYTQMITGREIQRPKSTAIHDLGTGTKHWTWSQIISVSKRRFLSRPVALEVFFQDGRSYLLTAMSEQERNKLYAGLLERSPKLQSSSAPEEDAWRLELLPGLREQPQTVGSRLASVFSLKSLLPATTRWVKGEISNFQYLMMVNTVAGRTFNDLTQYPIFPWVIADYRSDKLDLENPRTYRDLAKPMGCQDPSREAAFRERFQAFADMSVPAFHYGTHYSTAMIVTSYLIRLQPFVDSYLLLQGGTFDHADRLFYSIEKTWLSASQETMTDVRELTPEFFYLPDFLKNVNRYDFGSREANGEKINDVKLPPWAKGDPELFIAKNREALENPYVSQNLHSWIDLIFGVKQRGEAAVGAVNVFHHLSYQDATNLDTIGDGMERLATIGIIHNFGQTPAQVFDRPHERRESTRPKGKRLHRLIDALHRLPAPIYQHHSQISQLEYSVKQQRLLCCGPFRSFMPSKLNIVVEWGHTDNSIRFFNSDSKKPLGIFEQPHQDDILSAHFADNNLVTASRDCTVAIWSVFVDDDAVDLQLQGSLFGHRHPVSILRVSRPLSTILTIDSSGRILLWDLNSLDLVREIPNGRPVHYAQMNSSNGHIVLCCDQRIVLYSLNGKLLLDQNICTQQNDRIESCSFFESSSGEWIDAELIFTGQRWGVVNVWKLASASDGMWWLELVRRLDHVDRSRTDGRNMPCAITAICPMDHNLYTGDEEGNVFEWACSR